MRNEPILTNLLVNKFNYARVSDTYYYLKCRDFVFVSDKHTFVTY